jgi:hypothetical protein
MAIRMVYIAGATTWVEKSASESWIDPPNVTEAAATTASTRGAPSRTRWRTTMARAGSRAAMPSAASAA